MSDTIKLSMLGLPVMQSVDDFSEVTHISKYTLFQLSAGSAKHYRIFTIPKNNGTPRTICQPSKNLKGLQSWILVNILNKLKASTSCKGFEKGSSILDNVVPHTGANTVLTLDLSDFFPTVKRNHVYSIFRAVGYNSTIATLLTNICTCQGSLPQGSPCSPKLANLSAWVLDLRIQGYVGKRGISYTRYADDLTFSGLIPEKVVQIIPMIKKIIQDERFEINESKTRVAGAGRAKKVTGLIVSEQGIGIGRNKYKELRAKIHRLTLPDEQTNTQHLFAVEGWLSYLNSVDKKRFTKANKYLKELTAKHPTTLVSKLKQY